MFFPLRVKITGNKRQTPPHRCIGEFIITDTAGQRYYRCKEHGRIRDADGNDCTNKAVTYRSGEKFFTEKLDKLAAGQPQ